MQLALTAFNIFYRQPAYACGMRISVQHAARIPTRSKQVYVRAEFSGERSRVCNVIRENL